MVKITLIAGTYQPQQCGVAHYTAHLREHLSKQGIESTVLTTVKAAQSTKDITVQGVVQSWQLSQLFSFVKAIHQTRTDLLHIQHAAGTYSFDRSIFLLPLLLKLTGWHKPIVTTIHEYGWWEWQPQGIPPEWIEALKTWGQTRRLWDREDGFLLTQSNALITTNSEAEQAILQRLPHLKPIVHRIPIAANVDTLCLDRTHARQQVQQRCQWGKEAEIVAFFSFLHPVKGLETLFSAWQTVIATRPQARLLIIGGVESLALPEQQADRYWQKLQTQIRELNLTESVYMTGYLPAEQVSQCLQAADVGVLPFNPGVTLKSGSLLAMMAHALPIVATTADPADPDLTNSNLIYSINPRDVEGLSTAILHLLTDPMLRDWLGSNAYQFSQQFSWSKIVENHLQVYHAVL